jgi:hypothetical protein
LKSLIVPLLAILLACSPLTPAPAAAQQDIRLVGQLRPRVEDRDPEFRSPTTGKASMRVRLGASVTLPEDISLRIEVQDVLGLTAAPTAAAIELHQAFLDLGSLGTDALTARIGRHEMPIGNQRLLSNNNWGQRARRFDGLRLMFAGNTLRADGIVTRLPSGTSTLDRGWLFGGHAGWARSPGDSLDVYVLHQREREAFESDQLTAGGHGRINVVGFGLLGEAYYQTGTRRDEDVGAYFFAVGLARTVGPAALLASFDHYSGDDDVGDADNHAFDRLYGSNHSWHGYADLFTNIPVDTRGRGFEDLLVLALFAGESTDLQLDGHAFRATQERVTTSSKRFGEELDLVLRHRFRPGLTLEAGASYYRTGAAMTAAQGLNRDLVWGYGMVTLVF